jgi:hypothetical protein
LRAITRQSTFAVIRRENHAIESRFAAIIDSLEAVFIDDEVWPMDTIKLIE